MPAEKSFWWLRPHTTRALRWALKGMINTKKVNAVILALIIAFSACVPAFASSRVVDGTTYYFCDDCDYVTADKAAYDLHIASGDGDPTTTTTTAPATQAGSPSSDYVYNYYYECPACGKRYTNLNDYNNCLDSHNYGVDTRWDDYLGEENTLTDLFDFFMNYVKYFYESFYNYGYDELVIGNVRKFFNAITDAIMGLMGLVDNGASEADVAGAVDELDATINGVEKTSILAGFIDTIKSILNTIKQKIKDLYSGNKETTIVVTEAEAPAETGSANAGIAVFAAISVAAAAAFVCTKKKVA